MSTNPPKKKNGCLWLFVFCVLCFIGTIAVSVVLQQGIWLSFFIAAVISVFITIAFLGKPSISSLFKNVILVFGLILIVRYVLTTLLDFVNTFPTEDTTFVKEEGVGLSTIIEDQDTIPVYASHRVWKDNYGNNYQGDLTIRERDFNRLYQHLNSYSPPSGINFWGVLYDHIDRTDTPSLDLVMKTFEDIHRSRTLNQMEFAEMVISCIQDIPYSYVFQEECLPYGAYDEPIKTLLKECPECCIGNVKYGIQTPVSFLQNLKGDCDTRTVLIYSVLKHFNYDVAILNSDFYRHSIIGVNLPAGGLYKRYYGKKYVVWETTAKYYTAGQLPPSFNDITHWNVVLTSK